MSISTHVLDTMRGTPAAGLAVALHRREPDGDWKEVGQAETDADGRVRELADEELEAGEYRLEFDTRPYFERSGLSPEVVAQLTALGYKLVEQRRWGAVELIEIANHRLRGTSDSRLPAGAAAGY